MYLWRQYGVFYTCIIKEWKSWLCVQNSKHIGLWHHHTLVENLVTTCAGTIFLTYLICDGNNVVPPFHFKPQQVFIFISFRTCIVCELKWCIFYFHYTVWINTTFYWANIHTIRCDRCTSSTGSWKAVGQVCECTHTWFVYGLHMKYSVYTLQCIGNKDIHYRGTFHWWNFTLLHWSSWLHLKTVC